MRRVATLSDGLLTSRGAPGYIATIRAVLDAELSAAGKHPGSFPVDEGVTHIALRLASAWGRWHQAW